RRVPLEPATYRRPRHYHPNMETSRGIAAAFALVLALTACGSANNDLAKAAYDECVNPDAEIQLLRHDKNNVILEVKGDDARASARTDEEIKNLSEGDVSLDGISVMLAIVMGAECLAEQTDYPGTYDQLRDGDTWDGWK